MNDKSMELFRTLTEWPAAPGFEKSLQSFMIERLKDYSDEIVKDRLGSVFGVKHGDSEGPTVMVAGHLDEVGFMVTALTDQGLIRFQPLGGWSSQVLSSQRVQIITDDQSPIIGVITSTPPHLLSEAERNKAADMKNMFIDVGADDLDDLERMGIRPGLQIVPVSPFTPLANPKKILAKAWDNRYGVGLAIELMEEIYSKQIALPNTLYSGATVQEEVGLRGAETAAALVQPDLFFALDASPANDTSGTPNAFGKLGEGVLLRIMDRTMVTHQGMVEFIRDTAETHKIPYQYFISPGGTDAGKVHLHHTGVPSAVIGICARYIHTHASMIHTDDYAAAKELLLHLVKSADKTTLETLIS